MASALNALQGVLGPSSPITERSMKEALWNYFFDVESSIGYLLGKSPLRMLKAPTDILYPQRNSIKRKQRKLERKVSLISSAIASQMCACGVQHSDGHSSPLPTAEGPVTTSLPLSTSLATLSLEPLQQSAVLIPPINKLAAKIAAGKARMTAPSPPPSTSTPAAVVPEKKLSKLQLKMLASAAARKTPSAVPVAPILIPDLIPTPAPIPLVIMEPLATLLARPSSFASALAPRPSNSMEILSRIENSLARDSAIASLGIPAFEGPSPDDVVLNARKTTSLAPGVVPKRK